MGARNWGPADRSFRRTTRAASADSEVRPGPRLPTLCPYHLKTGEAGPEAPIHILPADSARLKPAAWNGRLERRWPVPVRLGRGRLHLLSREPGSEIGCLPPACGAPSSEGQLHPVRLTAAATLTSAGLCQMRCSRQPSNRPQGGPIRVCGGIATHRPRPRSVRPPQDHLPPLVGTPLFWRVDLDIRATSGAVDDDYGAANPGRAQRTGMVAARQRHGGLDCFERCLIVCASRTSTVGHRPRAGWIQRRHA